MPDFDRLVRHRVGLDQFGSNVVKNINILLTRTQADLHLQMQRALSGVEGRGDNLSPSERGRLKDLKKSLGEIQAEGHSIIYKRLKGELNDAADYEAEFAHRFYSEGIEAGVQLQKPSAGMLRSVVVSRPFQGAILRDWARKMEKAQLDRIWRQIQLGITEGESIDQMAARLKGSRAYGLKDGQFAKDKRNAEALVRTTVNHVTNRAHLATLEENIDLFPHYRWISILDSRTTPICRGRAGKVYKTESGPRPPAHWGCRSTIVGISKFEKAQNEPSFDEWLNRQSPAVQDEVLGPARGRLFRKGGLSVRRFVTGSGKPLTLKELKAREAAAWQRAN